jgi:hypothetical protein
MGRGAGPGVEQVATLHEGHGMHTFPADERRISEVERGRSCEAVVSLPTGGSLLAGEAVLFALAVFRPGEAPCYVKGGDSVLVSLASVTDLGATDPASGLALVRIAWGPPGRDVPPVNAPGRGVRSRRSH